MVETVSSTLVVKSVRWKESSRCLERFQEGRVF